MYVHGMTVENMIPILVINCAADTDRRKSFVSSTVGMNVRFIDAVDARLGASVFKPHISLLRDKFWFDDEIKPGAFACFISHRLAWQVMVDEGIPIALIAEDDSRFVQGMEFQDQTRSDIVFVNDRAQGWVHTRILKDILTTSPINPARGFGGDGYVLTLHAAQELLAQSEIDGVCCGVDWYLVFAGMDTQNLKHSYVNMVPEIKKLWKILGPRSSLLRASVSNTTLLVNNKKFVSSIKHSHRVNIKRFRQDIEKA
jgi:GR25 family glycosyltransferase involved in LPS biosynthesis